MKLPTIYIYNALARRKKLLSDVNLTDSKAIMSLDESTATPNLDQNPDSSGPKAYKWPNPSPSPKPDRTLDLNTKSWLDPWLPMNIETPSSEISTRLGNSDAFAFLSSCCC